MRSREDILKSVRANKPAAVSLPVIDMAKVTVYEDVTSQFKEIVKSIGVRVFEAADENDVHCFIDTQRRKRETVLNVADDTDASLRRSDARQLAMIDVAVIRGAVAVAENGAIWIDEKQMRNRLLPFICQHLVLVVYKKDIVATMHHAYKRIDIDKEGFGVFISGPSKTADIEQSLVIGAHGPVSMDVCLVGDGHTDECADSACLQPET